MNRRRAQAFRAQPETKLVPHLAHHKQEIIPPGPDSFECGREKVISRRKHLHGFQSLFRGRGSAEGEQFVGEVGARGSVYDGMVKSENDFAFLFLARTFCNKLR